MSNKQELNTCHEFNTESHIQSLTLLQSKNNDKGFVSINRDDCADSNENVHVCTELGCNVIISDNMRLPSQEII